MKMSQKKSQGNPKFSRLRLRSATAASISKKSSSPHIDPREKISSYFSLATTSQVQSEELFPSVSETQCGQQFSSNPENTTLDEENDFSKPKLIKPVKSFEIKVEKESKVTRKRTRNKNNLNRFIKDLGPSCSDTNQENLQLALAMSKSVADFEKITQNNEDDNDSPYPSTQQKLDGIKKTLDQFGFKSDRNPIELPTTKNNTKQKKKFKYLTPTLFLRTEEDRAKIVENNVSGILSSISVYNKYTESWKEEIDEFVNNKPKSFMLRDYYDENSTLFNKNNLNLDEIKESTYYNKIVPKEIIKTGVLLKDWHAIPGREKTPPINVVVEETENMIEEENVDTNDRSISPELFSDSETELSTTPPKNLLHIEKSPHNSPLSSINLSPIVIISSNSKNSHISCEKEIFSDDSDAKSLSLLDNISPHRQKKLFQRNLSKSPAKKALFKNTLNSDSLLNSTCLNKSDSPIKSDSPVKTFEDNEICHYESFQDNSNDCFELLKSSDDSNIFNQDTIIHPLTSQIVDVPPISENLFSNDIDFVLEKTEEKTNNNFDQFVLKNNEVYDLTQSSNDSNATSFEKHKNDTIIQNKSVFESDTSLWKENNIIKSNSNEDKKSKENNSIKTVLFQNNTLDIIENAENCNKLNISVENLNKSEFLNKENSNDSIKTVVLIENSPDIAENTTLIMPHLENSNETVNTVIQNSPKYQENFEINTVQNFVLEEDEYSPEFNILNSSNNKEFYDSLSKSESVISNSESDNENPNNEYSKLIKNNEEIKNRKSFSPNKFLEISSVENSTPKRKSKSFRKSFSENVISSKELTFVSNANETNFFKLSSPLNITKFHTLPNDLKLPETEDNYKFNLSDVEISDEEINYSSKKSINDVNKSTENNISVENREEDLQSQSSIDTNSDCDISDEELNYSTNNSFRIRQLNKEIESILNTQEKNEMNFIDLPYTGLEPSSSNTENTLNYAKTQPEIQHPRVKDLKTPNKLRRSFSESCILPNDTFELNHSKITSDMMDNKSTPENTKNASIVITPNNDYIIKTKDVTPMPNFHEMDTPQIRQELDKYGIKPLKRAKGIKILQYIYDSTHPIIDKSGEKIRKSSSDDEDGRIIKRRKKNISPKKTEEINETEIECIGNAIAESESIADMIFERKQSVRISSCRIPLHIVWHNFVSSNPDLHEKILLYEPIQVEEIYAKLKLFGYKFHIQDIITFLDRKCITIRIAQNSKKSTGK